MNTIAFESSEDLSEFGHVRKSILNFGLPDVGHRTLEDEGVRDVGKGDRRGLVQFRGLAAGSQIRTHSARRSDRS